MKVLKTGKLDSDLLKSLVIDKIRLKRPEILTRAAVGEDCAVADFGEYECVISTDPITADTKDIGRLSVIISCNDIASNGVQPLAIVLTVLLPEGVTDDDVEMITDQAALAAEQAGVEIAGGHTEITSAVNKPVIVSTAFGRALKGKSQSVRNMRPGDRLLLSKSAGLEGTGILASDGEEVMKKVLSRKELERAKSFLDRLSVIREGVIAAGVGTSGMHDVTEGGIYGAVWEVCTAGGKGAVLEEEKIHVEPETLKICEYLGADWRRMVSSGAMLITAAPEKAEEIIRLCGEEGIPVTDIGEIRPPEEGIKVFEKGHSEGRARSEGKYGTEDGARSGVKGSSEGGNCSESKYCSENGTCPESKYDSEDGNCTAGAATDYDKPPAGCRDGRILVPMEPPRPDEIYTALTKLEEIKLKKL